MLLIEKRSVLYTHNVEPFCGSGPLRSSLYTDIKIYETTMEEILKRLPLERSSVQTARTRIQEHIHVTPVMTSKTISDLASTPQSEEALVGTPFEGQTPACPKIQVFFKCENYQRIGAFKSRGAFHALSHLSGEQLSRGVVTHSSGWSPGCLKIYLMR